MIMIKTKGLLYFVMQFNLKFVKWNSIFVQTFLTLVESNWNAVIHSVNMRTVISKWNCHLHLPGSHKQVFELLLSFEKCCFWMLNVYSGWNMFIPNDWSLKANAQRQAARQTDGKTEKNIKEITHLLNEIINSMTLMYKF